jgi:hypothetical protein
MGAICLGAHNNQYVHDKLSQLEAEIQSTATGIQRSKDFAAECRTEAKRLKVGGHRDQAKHFVFRMARHEQEALRMEKKRHQLVEMQFQLQKVGDVISSTKLMEEVNKLLQSLSKSHNIKSVEQTNAEIQLNIEQNQKVQEAASQPLDTRLDDAALEELLNGLGPDTTLDDASELVHTADDFSISHLQALMAPTGPLSGGTGGPGTGPGSTPGLEAMPV